MLPERSGEGDAGVGLGDAESRAAAVHARDSELLLYDYSKHLLSLALISIGGVITIAQSSLGKSIPNKDVGIIIILLALCGVLALMCSVAVLTARQRGEPLPKSGWVLNQLAMGALGAGFGYFLMTWLDILF